MAIDCTHTQRIIRTIKDILFVLDRKLFTVPEARLVESVQVGEMNSKPHQTTLAKRLLDAEREQTSCEIVSNRVQMRWHRICSTSEIEVVGDVKDVVQILQDVSFDHESGSATYRTCNLEIIIKLAPL